MLPQQIQDLKAAVERIASGAPSAEDKQLLRDAHAAGEVAIASDNSLVNLGTISNSTVIIAKNSTVTFEPAGIARILEILEEEHNPQPRLDRPIIRGSLFYFGTRANHFVGRRRYLEQLQSFLDVDVPFQWWVLTGTAGSGKSRLALEFGIESQNKWSWGFLPEQTPERKFDWNRWFPQEPTLLIIDYAASSAETVSQIVEALTYRSADLRKKVRLVLLERSISGPWWERDFLKSGSRREALLSSMHQRDVMQLDALSDDDLGEIYKQNSGVNIVDANEMSSTLAVLKGIDPHGRPLFAALAGDATARGRDIRKWDEEKLLDFHRTETEKRWGPQGVRDEDLALLIFVTMVGGIKVDQIPMIDLKPYMPDEESFRPELYQVMVGAPSEDFLAPFEPDILGEYFVLEFLKPKPLSKKKVRDFARAIWQHETFSILVFSFIGRALDDFLDKPALRYLLEPSEANFSLGWQVAFNEYIRHKAQVDVDAARMLFLEAQSLHAGKTLPGLFWLGRAETAQVLCLRYLTLGRPTDAKLMYEMVAALVSKFGDLPFLPECKATCEWALADFYLDQKDVHLGQQYFADMMESILRSDESKMAAEVQSKCSRLAVKLMAELNDSEADSETFIKYIGQVQKLLGRVREKAKHWREGNYSQEMDTAWWASTNVLVKLYLSKDELEQAFSACLGAITETTNRVSVLYSRAEILDRLSVGIIRRLASSLFKEVFSEEQSRIVASAHSIVQQALEALQKFQEGQDGTLFQMWVFALIWSLHPLFRFHCLTGDTGECEKSLDLLARTAGLLTAEQQKEMDLEERMVDCLVLCAVGHALEQEWKKLFRSVDELMVKYSGVSPSFETSLLFAFVVGSSQRLPISDEDRDALRKLVPVLLDYFDSSGAADLAAAKTGGSRDQKLAMYKSLLEPEGSIESIIGEARA